MIKEKESEAIPIDKYYYALDCEWVADDKRRVKFPEIISVGVVKMSESHQIVDTFYRVIKPIINTYIPPFTFELTKLTQEEIDKGTTFDNCMNDLEAFLNHDPLSVIYSWGNEDQSVFRRNLKRFKSKSFVPKCIKDIQEDICRTITYEDAYISNQISIKNLKKIYQIENIEDHNALNDAISLGLILQKTYLKAPKDEVVLKELFLKNKNQLDHVFVPELTINSPGNEVLLQLKTLLIEFGLPESVLFQIKKKKLFLKGKAPIPVTQIHLKIEYESKPGRYNFSFHLIDNDTCLRTYYISVDRSKRLKIIKNLYKKINRVNEEKGGKK